MLSWGFGASKRHGSTYFVSWVKYYRILFIRDFDIYGPQGQLHDMWLVQSNRPGLDLMSCCHRSENAFPLA